VHIRTKKNGSGGNNFKDFPTNNIVQWGRAAAAECQQLQMRVRVI